MAGIRPCQKKSFRRALFAWKTRDELSKNNPNMAIYCYDVQGHLHLEVEVVVREGYRGITNARKKGNCI